MVATGSVVTIDGQELYSETAGAGEPVLLLHGGFCSLESLRPQAEALASDFTVHAYERPGHGRSPDTDGEYGYAASLVQAVRYLDAVGVGAAHVVGYSDGAILGLLLALHHPERVRSLVAISGNLDPSAFDGPSLPGPLVDRPAEERPDREREHHARLSPDGPEHADVVLAKLVRLWTTEPSIDPAELAAITAPTLVLSGDRDTIPPAHSLLIASHVPGAQLAILPGASHALVAEHPEVVTLFLRQFLLAQR